MNEKSQKTNDRQYYLFALRIVGDFGATIAVPVLLFVYLGRYLDSKYGSGVLYTILGFVTAAVLSGTIIYKKAKKYGKEYQTLVDRGLK